MGRIQDLEVYKASYQFSKMIMRTKLNMPKSFKNDVGQLALMAALQITRSIVIANGVRDKEKFIYRAVLEIDVIWQLLRMMYEFQVISAGEFKAISEKLYDLSEQLKKWLNWARKQSKNNTES